jgi:hypothetical protein
MATKRHWMLTYGLRMAEPTRKKNKKHGTVVVLPFPPALDETSLVFLTTHKTNPCLVDLTELRDGRYGSESITTCVGDFSGRPLLIQQLLPHIRAIHLAQAKKSIEQLISTLRTYWRLFDECDALPINQRPKPVEGVAELNDLHDRLQVRNRVHGNHTRSFVRLANAARKQVGLTQLDWTPMDPDRGKVRVALEMAQTRALYHEVKSHVRRIYTAWENDAGLVPSKRDCLFILTFLLIKTGWNEAVALNIDCEDYLRAHVGDADRHLLHSIKVRAGGTEQVHVGQNKEEWSPGNLVKKMIERSEPLRDLLREQLAQLEMQTEGQLLTDAQTLQIAVLKQSIRSPWLHATMSWRCNIEDFDQNDPEWAIKALVHIDISNQGFPGRTNLITYLQGQANATLASHGHAPIDKITLSDLRDAYINWAYSSNGYEWMMAKLAAGHTTIQAAISYLRTRALKQHGETAVRQLTTIVFDEIKTRNRLDPIFLYARVNRGSVSEEQRQRWAQGKDRTRVGTGCADFKHPPKHMAPHHQEGKGCRTQRCTLCEHGVVFHDSYHHLARRKAELLDYQSKVGMMIWATTDFPEEVLKLEQTLAAYDQTLVAESLAHWQEEINAGRHIPPTFEGSYE